MTTSANSEGGSNLPDTRVKQRSHIFLTEADGANRVLVQ